MHNDRDDRMPVCVYNWLTDAEYAEAKKNYRLANQIAPTSPSKSDVSSLSSHASFKFTHP